MTFAVTVAANVMPAHQPASGLRIEPKDAQFLIAAACLCDACGPRNGLLARGQFEHGEAAVEWGCPRVATLGDGAVSGDERGRHIFVNAAAEDVDAGGLCFVDHGMCVAAHGLPLAVGHDHRRAGEGDEILGHAAPPFEMYRSPYLPVKSLSSISQA